MKQLEKGELLLHVGPHKTGSTTLQHGFHHNRERLHAQGVHYGGPFTQPMSAAMYAATGQPLAIRTDAADMWDELVEEVRSTEHDRTVVSSEFFCEADEAHAAAILEQLGGDKVQVVITLRPLTRILASQWQQFVQNRVVTDYPSWLGDVLSDLSTPTTPVFWARHRHDVLVRRWAAVAGAGRVTVVVLDERDPESLLRTFEELIGVTPGTLDPGDVSANRSLRYAEVEMLRRFNEEWRDHGWSDADYTRWVRFGAVRQMQQRRPGEDEARILTPSWAVERAQEIAADFVTAVEETGVDVIGDPRSLTDGLPPDAVGDNGPADTVPLDAAARFSAGLALRIAFRTLQPMPPEGTIGPLEVAARQVRAQLKAPDRALAEDPLAGMSVAELLRATGRAAADVVRRR